MAETTQPTVLIVEDDTFLLDAYKMKFTHLDAQVELAANGEQAWEKVQDLHPNLIILDLFMPKLDGFGFLEKLQADEQLSDTPVIVATNLSDEQTTTRLKMYENVKDIFIKSEIAINDLLERCKVLLV